MEAVRNHTALFDLSNSAILRAHGEDAVRYLHGRITQDVQGIAPGEGAASLVLTPQGRVQGKFYLLRREEDLLIISDPLKNPNDVEPLRDALLQFRVADQVELAVESPETTVLSLQGPAADKILKELAEILPSVEPFSHIEATIKGTAITAVRHARGSESGIDLLVPQSEVANLRPLLPPFFSEIDLEPLRIRAAIPYMGRELTEKTQAGDINLDGLVSFQKGCYAGQETVEMTIARGRPNKQLILFSLPGEKSIEPECPITAEDRSCGVITSCAYAPATERTYCLGFLKTSVEPTVEITANGYTLEREVSPAETASP